MWTSPIGTERRDTKILAGDDVATAFTLHRTSGTLKTGREVNYWLRVTVGCTRSDRGWRIAHEHVSIPIDFASGKVVMDLVP
jgi:ketosteroid isomerase-like protein